MTSNKEKGMPSDMNTLSQYQGIVWEAGLLPGRLLLFPVNHGRGGICIGTEETDGPDLLIKAEGYVYFYVSSAGNGNPHDYYVITDYDGPFMPAHSGDVFKFGKESFRLV